MNRTRRPDTADTEAAAVIRLLTAGDVDAFTAVRLRSLHEHPTAFAMDPDEEVRATRAEVGERLSPDDDGFVVGAFVEGRLVGVVGLRRDARLKLRHKAMVWGMYVAPEARDRGLGGRLLDEVIRRAPTLEGVERLGLWVAAANESAKRLYRSRGFVVYGTEPDSLRVDGISYEEDLMTLRL